MFIHHIALNTVHESDFFEDNPKGMIDFLFLVFKTKTTCIINGSTYVITSPSVILIDHYTPYTYYPNGSQHIDDYLHFAVDDRSAFIEKLTFPLNKPITLSNDSAILRVLETINLENKPHKKYIQKTMDLLLQLLLLKLEEEWDAFQQADEELPHLHQLLAIRSKIFESPGKLWTIEELADMAHLSNAYFQVLYKKAFGVTCITDVIDVKIAEAKTYLTSTNLPIYKIAEALGYTDVTHFIRQFKKITGLTPNAFRKKGDPTK